MKAFFRFLISVSAGLLLVLALPAQAQEITGEQITTTVGPFSVIHPDNWIALAGPDGTLIIAERNPDSTEAAASTTIAENAVVAQVRTYGLNRIPAADPSAQDILNALLVSGSQPDTELPEISVSTSANLEFARADVSTPDQEALLYTSILNDVSFAIIVVSTQGSAELAPNEAALLEILDTVTLTFETADIEAARARYADLPQQLTDEGFPVLGNPEAPVQLVEISSFDCPACRMFHDEILPLLMPRIAAGEIAYVYVPVFGTGSLPDGDSAARAALCVPEFWAYHDVLFELQDEGGFAFLYERLLLEAAALGTEAAAFDACFISDETTQTLQNAFQFAGLYIDRLSTPTIIINGEPVPFNPVALDAAIEAALTGTSEQ